MENGNYDRVVNTLASADPGFVMKNDKNGRSVFVRNSEKYMYYCSDHANGIYYSTSSEDEAYRWLDGTLLAGWDSSKKKQPGKHIA